jgi:hypothetical protein
MSDKDTDTHIKRIFNSKTISDYRDTILDLSGKGSWVIDSDITAPIKLDRRYMRELKRERLFRASFTFLNSVSNKYKGSLRPILASPLKPSCPTLTHPIISHR